ncbi:hypothetical protein KIPB_014895 [Kipferlia bialata]|uniref:Uncharacterized protein n=1 Tax=Kipferlia bialata TaxID=797122 RepID=A0A9K3DC64_9EUKA|nr:hypothetical protein KIPB_014895 [Kipferlia bialata]|eukprot:g14895.t1
MQDRTLELLSSDAESVLCTNPDSIVKFIDSAVDTDHRLWTEARRLKLEEFVSSESASLASQRDREWVGDTYRWEYNNLETLF